MHCQWGTIPDQFLGATVSRQSAHMFLYDLERPISGGSGFRVADEKPSMMRRGEIEQPLHVHVDDSGFHVTWKVHAIGRGGITPVEKVYFFWRLKPATGGRRYFEFDGGNASSVCTAQKGFTVDRSPHEPGSASILEEHSLRIAHAFAEKVCRLNNDIIFIPIQKG